MTDADDALVADAHARAADPGDPGGNVDDALAAVRSHVAAFNAADVDAVMTRFDPEAVFATADQLVVGARAIRQLFADSFAAPVDAHIELLAAVVDGDIVACELAERISGEGFSHDIAVAAFYTVRDGRIARVRIYRDLAP